MSWSDLLLAAGGKLLLLALANAGAAAAIAFALFKWFGEKWLEGKFAQKLERLKHDQAKEIEGMRQKVQATFSRISKIHEKEFEVLPKAWFLLHDAHGKAGHLMLALKRYPDFDRLPYLEFEAFLKESRLSNTQKEEMRRAGDVGAPGDRLRYYIEAMFWISLNDAHSAQVTLHNYIIENRIFMTKELHDGFSGVSDTLFDALLEHRQWKEGLGNGLQKASIDKFSPLQQKIDEIETAAKKRLHTESA